MKFDKQVIKEIRNIAIGIFILSSVLVAVCTGLGRFSVRLLTFNVIGSLVAFAGFVWLCYSVTKTLESGENAHGYMTKSYMGRMVLNAVWVVLAFKFAGAYENIIAGALPVLFPSMTIKIMNLFKTLKKEEE